mmetsp:Transcript_37989/g.69425  ORF Transcript_37989/g.69425 Transcript_37989/m.69425 type:complete len:145 (+) Transcript_37989:36-470(+)
MSGEEEDTLGLLFGEQMTDPLASSAEAYPFTRTEEQWRSLLTADEYRVLRQRGTESYGKGAYCQFFPKTGHFRCKACKFSLYASTSKFKDRGWDGYQDCYWTGESCHVAVRGSIGHCEIACRNCGSHLGHVFFGARQSVTSERH